MLGQCKSVEAFRYSRLYHFLQGILCMSAELPRVAVMRIGHGERGVVTLNLNPARRIRSIRKIWKLFR